MYNPKSMKADEFISDEEIRETLSYAEKNKDNIELIDSIIEKAKLRKGLNHHADRRGRPDRQRAGCRGRPLGPHAGLRL